MDSLIRLIRGLTTVEIHFVRIYYTSRSLEKSKRFRLFSLIAAGKIKSNTDALEMIYKGKQNARSAYSHLKRKLSEDILNIMVVTSLEDHLSREDSQEIQCRRSLIQSEILLSRGLLDEGISLLRKTKTLADKYDFPDISLASFNLLSKYHQIVNRENHFRQFEKSLQNYQKLLKVKAAYYFGCEDSDHRTGPDDGSGIHACKTRYWQKLREVENLYGCKEYGKARAGALDLLTWMENAAALNQEVYICRLYRILAEILLHLGENEQSHAYAKKACLNSLPFYEDYHAASITLFFACLRCGYLNEAETIYYEATAKKDLDHVVSNKWLLLKATLAFAGRNFNSVNTILSGWNGRYSEHPGWMLSPRLLELLTILEVRDYDRYEYRFECLRKKLATVRSRVTGRVKMVCYLLQSLIRESFDYDLLVEKERDNFNKLEGSSPELCWDPLGCELINVPHWLINKTHQFKTGDFRIA